MSLRSVFLAHAESDQDFAVRLAEFLEAGCDVSCDPSEGVIQPGEDLISKAEEGLTADALVLLLSKASCPARWQRERWEPVLFEQAAGIGVEVAALLLDECSFPPLLRRRNFFDATTASLTAMRLLKRRLWRTHHKTADPPTSAFSSDLEHLYSGLGDKAGTLEASGEAAARFAREAGHDFEAVLWVPCHRRSLAQIAGELGVQLGLILEDTAEQNCQRLRDFLSGRRCLLVLDAPAPEAVTAFVPNGRTSTLITLEPVSVVESLDTVAYARTLVSSHRYAEAYELLYRLLESGTSPESCARELTWICDRWNRVEEANSLRFRFGPAPFEQLTLF